MYFYMQMFPIFSKIGQQFSVNCQEYFMTSDVNIYHGYMILFLLSRNVVREYVLFMNIYFYTLYITNSTYYEKAKYNMLYIE